MSHDYHPDRERKQREQKRRDQLTALLAGVGTGLGFALLIGLLLETWPFALGVGVVIALAITFGLNAIRKDSREIADNAPESEV